MDTMTDGSPMPAATRRRPRRRVGPGALGAVAAVALVLGAVGGVASRGLIGDAGPGAPTPAP